MLANTARLLTSALGLIMAFSASTAKADYFDTSYLSLSYVQPTGTATPTEIIDVYVTLTLAANAPQALLLDFRDVPNFVGPDNLLPTTGETVNEFGEIVTVPFATYDTTFGPPGYGSGLFCAGEFVGVGCGGGAYEGWTQGTQPYLSLAPGESVTWKALELRPKNGVAAPGVYRVSLSGVEIDAYGWDDQGRTVYGHTWLVYPTFPGENGVEFGFTRTVVAVPEPESIALILAGLAVIGVKRRKAA